MNYHGFPIPTNNKELMKFIEARSKAVIAHYGDEARFAKYAYDEILYLLKKIDD